MALYHDNSHGSGPKTSEPQPHHEIPASMPGISATWKEWQERQLSAFVFAIGVKSGRNELDMAQLEASRITARRALLIASTLSYPYPVDTVEEIGRIVIGETKALETHAMNIGSHVLKLIKSAHPIEAPRLAQWLTLWSTYEGGPGDLELAIASREWPARFEHGLDLAEKPHHDRSNRRK